ncbi:hypothetical protein LSAT2_014290 [Lamellibrachia satsuma]|nr:hypothetical protein LSAT2_014290 [Lamellibrachia satsuma]
MFYVCTEQPRTEEKQTSLTAAKDRAQLTATTAMSVVHVALLKSLIDGGPEANRYYTIVIVLIVIALVLQVVIGIIAIFVTHTRNYYEKYHSDMCSEFTSDWFKCFWRDHNDAPPQGVVNLGLDVSSVEVVVGEDALGCGPRNGVAATGDLAWKLSTTTKKGVDAVTAEINESISVRLLQAELSAIEAEAELHRLNQQLARETKRFETYKVNDSNRHAEDSPSDLTKALEVTHEEVDSSDLTKALEAGPEVVGSSLITQALEARQKRVNGNEKDMGESQKRLLEIEAEIVKCEATIRRLDVLRRQDKLLSGYVDDAQMANVLKKVSFWQNVINYLLYTVFICNAFITGLGVTGGQGGN